MLAVVFSVELVKDQYYLILNTYVKRNLLQKISDVLGFVLLSPSRFLQSGLDLEHQHDKVLFFVRILLVRKTCCTLLHVNKSRCAARTFLETPSYSLCRTSKSVLPPVSNDLINFKTICFISYLINHIVCNFAGRVDASGGRSVGDERGL